MPDNYSVFRDCASSSEYNLTLRDSTSGSGYCAGTISADNFLLLPAGIYFVKVNGWYVQKIVKQ